MRLLLIILFAMFTTVAWSVHFNHLGVKDGLPQLSVHAIYQDKLGRIWFGTEEGLCIYNGEEMTGYKNYSSLLNKSVSDYAVRHVTGTDEGDIFFTIASLLVRYDLQHDSFHTLHGNISSLQKTQGQVFCSSRDTIFRWNFSQKRMEVHLITGIKNTITAVCYDHKKRLWFGTRKGLYMLNDGTKNIQCIIPNTDISTLFESSVHDMWIGTRLDGAFVYTADNKLNTFKYCKGGGTISHNHIRAITEDFQGNIWIGTFNGLNKYIPQTKQFVSYKKDYVRGSLSHSSILSLFLDSQANLWVGTYYGGVNYFNSKKERFNFYPADPLRKECLNFPFVGQMVEDNENNLWICTDGGGLNKLERETGLFSYYTVSSHLNSIKHNNVKCIDYDSEKNELYVGTYTGGICRFNLNNQEFYNYIDHISSIIQHSNISWLKIYKEYVIFVDDYGLFKIHKETNEITPLFPGSNQRKYYGNQFIIDSKNQLWLAHFNGITCISLDNPSVQKQFSIGEKGLGNALISSILETADHQIVISTIGNGIFVYHNNYFVNYNANKNQIISDFCYSMAEIQDGNLIIGCSKGLSILNLTTGEQIYSASIAKDLPFSAMNAGCGIYVCKNQEIFVGSADGMLSFKKNDVMAEDNDCELYFSSLHINHKKITPQSSNGILTMIPAYTHKLVLSHKQNNLVLNFSNSYPLQSNKSLVYEYKLEGFDKEWISTYNKYLNYTNLLPGTYTLYVRKKSFNKNQDKGIQMSIIILPPFYNTFWAWVLYIILLSCLFYAFLRFRQRRIILKTSLEYERREKERIINLNRAKITFFTNVSHEFRTPLSLIISQIELLLNENTISLAIRNRINKLYRNASQMQNLVNELLDFQKAEQKQLFLQVYENDLIPFLYDIFVLFDEKAKNNQIHYTFSSSNEAILCWFDPNELKKAIVNILSNAFKFTPMCGNIELTVNIEKDDIIIRIIDSGIGIDKKEQSSIFERYYQSSNSIFTSSKEFSTGLGLALCKEIIELHHGTIAVESKLNYGSIFIVTLLSGKQHFEQDAHVKIGKDSQMEPTINQTTINTLVEDDAFFDGISSARSVDSTLRYKLLIVEDNRELQETLYDLFSPFYQIIQAYDGVEGFKMAHDKEPDIIVSDIMMPKMYGDQMCMNLKQDLTTCHIPIVLLTALSSTEDNIKGLIKGADDYISKPFNTRILLIKCNNLIRNRLLLQQKYRNAPVSEISLLASNKIDKNFLSKIEIIIDSHLDDTEFSIDRLAEEISVSRRSLFNKFKQLTGMTPNEFILNYKLKKAAFLLKENTSMQIGEIADKLGFGSSRYFSRCFKNQFQVSPQEYRNS